MTVAVATLPPVETVAAQVLAAVWARVTADAETPAVAATAAFMAATTAAEGLL